MTAVFLYVRMNIPGKSIRGRGARRTVSFGKDRDMSNRPYRLGVIVGRFQTFHLGHQDMIDTATELCEEVGVFIGSSQESGTEKNPFPYEVREALIRRIYGESIRIFPLPDIGVGNNAKWGEYVLKNVSDRFGRLPELFISGKEGRRESWLSGEAGMGTAELYIPKSIEISASEMRGFFINNDAEAWRRYTDPRLWDSFGELRRLVMDSRMNTGTASI